VVSKTGSGGASRGRKYGCKSDLGVDPSHVIPGWQIHPKDGPCPFSSRGAKERKRQKIQGKEKKLRE